MINADQERVDETRWRASLTSEQVRELLTKALREDFGTPHNGLSLKVQVDGFDPDHMPGMEVELVHDHKWFMKVEKEKGETQ